MKVTWPHLGHSDIVLKSLFRDLGVDMVIAPPNNKHSLTLGVKHSPEFVCLPFKLTLGNMIEGLELGGDTIIMAAGSGLCRFGYYAKVQERILRDLGYEFDMVTTALFESKIVGVARLVKRLSGGAPLSKVIAAIRLGLAKLSAMDDIERAVHRVRAIEINKGIATKLFQEAINAIDYASDMSGLKKAKMDYIAQLNDVAVDTKIDPLKVGVMGEFYVVLEPFANMDVEIELGKLGVEVKRSLFVSHWTKFSLFLNAFGVTEKEKTHRAAMPYLKRDVGGDGWESVGEVVLHAHSYNGLVHLSPFTCMPEIIAQNIMPSIKADIPVLTLISDEQMGRAGMLTRLEAFVDLLHRRRSASLAGALG
ncbi:MAG: CoA protein activase [Chloroflexi bacterium]|nr:CoA protein activase [Chloroflexota bacterium]